MLSDAERKVLNIGLQKYRPGQSQPILAGAEKLLKPALRLMSVYRLRIDEIKEGAVVASYTRLLEITKKTDLTISIKSLERSKHRRVTSVIFAIKEQAVPKG